MADIARVSVWWMHKAFVRSGRYSPTEVVMAWKLLVVDQWQEVESDEQIIELVRTGFASPHSMVQHDSWPRAKVISSVAMLQPHITSPAAINVTATAVAVAPRRGMNHPLHIVLCLVSCGAWLPIYAIVAVLDAVDKR